MTETNKTALDRKEKVTEWFAGLVGTLRTDEQGIEHGYISPEKEEMYNKMIFGDMKEVALDTGERSSRVIISMMLREYFSELDKVKSHPIKLALYLSNSKILVWAEVQDDDDATEDALILTEAEINARYSQHGYYISSTIVEECDMLSVPDHYNNVEIRA